MKTKFDTKLVRTCNYSWCSWLRPLCWISILLEPVNTFVQPKLPLTLPDVTNSKVYTALYGRCVIFLQLVGSKLSRQHVGDTYLTLQPTKPQPQTAGMRGSIGSGELLPTH